MERMEKTKEEKKLYYKFSDNADVAGVIMELSGVVAWIEADESEVSADDDPREYTITPVWLTDEEYAALPEADI